MVSTSLLLDCTSGTLTAYQFAAKRMNQRQVARFIEMVHQLLIYQRAYFNQKDKEVKRMLLIQCKQREKELKDELFALGVRFDL